jgi:hypothetical protein
MRPDRGSGPALSSRSVRRDRGERVETGSGPAPATRTRRTEARDVAFCEKSVPSPPMSFTRVSTGPTRAGDRWGLVGTDALVLNAVRGVASSYLKPASRPLGISLGSAGIFLGILIAGAGCCAGRSASACAAGHRSGLQRIGGHRADRGDRATSAGPAGASTTRCAGHRNGPLLHRRSGRPPAYRCAAKAHLSR